MKSSAVCYWYVKLPPCKYMEHGLEYIMCYVQKQMAPSAACSGLPLVRDGPLFAYWLTYWDMSWCLEPTTCQEWAAGQLCWNQNNNEFIDRAHSIRCCQFWLWPWSCPSPFQDEIFNQPYVGSAYSDCQEMKILFASVVAGRLWTMRDITNTSYGVTWDFSVSTCLVFISFEQDGDMISVTTNLLCSSNLYF